jgi:hypothetical protein
MDTTNDPVAYRWKSDLGYIYDIYDHGNGEPLYTHPSEHDLGIAEAIGFEKGFNTNKLDDLTKEEILCLWDWWSGEVLATDILDFADTYKRVLLGEEGLLEWHQEYVKRMNSERT